MESLHLSGRKKTNKSEEWFIEEENDLPKLSGLSVEPQEHVYNHSGKCEMNKYGQCKNGYRYFCPHCDYGLGGMFSKCLNKSCSMNEEIKTKPFVLNALMMPPQMFQRFDNNTKMFYLNINTEHVLNVLMDSVLDLNINYDILNVSDIEDKKIQKIIKSDLLYVVIDSIKEMFYVPITNEELLEENNDISQEDESGIIHDNIIETTYDDFIKSCLREKMKKNLDELIVNRTILLSSKF
jgi:hypothetical protein